MQPPCLSLERHFSSRVKGEHTEGCCEKSGVPELGDRQTDGHQGSLLATRAILAALVHSGGEEGSQRSRT